MLRKLTLFHDDDGPYFVADVEGTTVQWLAIPLDPIGNGHYEGRLQIIGPIIDPSLN